MNTLINKNKVTPKSKVALWCSIPIVIGGIILSKTYANQEIINKLMNILCASIGGSIGIIAFIRKENSGVYYRSIGIGFIFLSSIEYIYILTDYINIKYLSEEVIGSIMTNAQFYLEYLIIILPYLLSKRKSKLAHSFISYFLCVIVVIGLSGVIYDTQGVESGVEFYRSNSVYLIVCLLIAIFLTRETKNFILKVDRWYIYAYLAIIFISQAVFMIDGVELSSIRFYSDIMKYCGYFILYEGTIEHLLSVVYSDMKRDLENMKKVQKDVNKELNIRKDILSDYTRSLNKSEKYYNQMLSKFDDAIILLYLDKVVYLNDSAEALLKIKYKEYLIGRDLEKVIDLILLMIVDNNTKEYYDILKCKINVLKKGEAYICKGIKSMGFEYELYIVKSDDLNHIVYIRNVTDISRGIEERKKYEELLKEKDLKEDFYMNISHELRTPVNVIYSALQLKDIYIRDENHEMIKKHNEIIKQNCLRLIRTINNFIDTNKISEGFMKPDFKTYNIVEVIENIAQASIKYIKRIDSELIFDSEEEEIYTRFDKIMIERVILNLLSNSVKYGKSGGKIYINIHLDGDIIIVSLKNNGLLIPVDAHPYIFEKFTKTDSSLSRGKEGSGLGLYLVNELIKLNSGVLDLVTNNNGENEFILKLPLRYSTTDIIYTELMEMNTLEEKVDIEFSDIYI